MTRENSLWRNGKYSKEAEYLAMLGLFFGTPSILVTMFVLRLLNLEQGLISSLRMIGFLNILFPGPTITLALYLFLLLVMIFVCSIVAYVRGPKEKSDSRPLIFLILPLETILIIGVPTIYFANIIWRVIFGYLNVRVGWSILVIAFGVIPAFILIPVILDLIFSRLWALLFKRTVGIFRGHFQARLIQALKKEVLKKEITEYSKILLIGIPILIAAEIILAILGLF